MAAALKPRTRTNDPTSTRSRVLDATVTLFHRKGYNETSMHDIMEAAKVTSGALHHHYPNKKDLGLAVIRERVAGMVAEAWIDPLAQAPDAAVGIADAFNNIIAGLQEGSIVGCPLNNLALELAYAEPEFRAEIQQIFDRWHGALSQRISDTGLISAELDMSPDELATMIIASYSGAMTMAKTAQTAQPLKVALKLLTSFWTPASTFG